MNSSERLTELAKAPIGRLLWKYSLPAVTGIVVMSVYTIIDRIFIGRGVGPDAIAGLAITFPVTNIHAAIGVLIGVGASARTSIVLGRGDHKYAEEILGNSFVMTLVLGIALVGLFAIFMDPKLRLFGASDASLPYAREFLTYLMPGMVIINITYSFNNIMRATGYPMKAMLTMLMVAGLNVVFCPIFIFWLGWGIKGAAIATDLAMTAGAIYTIAHFMRRKSEIHFRRGTFRLHRRILYPIMAIGAAPCIVNTAGCVINAVINNTVYMYGGDSGVAAIGIFTAIAQLIVMFVIGVTQGMQPIVGYNYGAQQFDRLKRAFWYTVGVASAVCTTGALASQLCPRAITSMFTVDAQLLDAGEQALRLTMWMFWVVGIQVVTTNFFQALGRAGKSIFMSLTRQVIFLLPLLFTLPSMFGLNGVWLSFPLSDGAATAVTLFLLRLEFKHINGLIAAQK